jgi:uncharacterized membrane protein YjfL (UPF0719 family)
MFDEYYVWVAGIVLLDLILAIAAISMLRLVRGISAGVNTTDELSKKDNFAFGISFAGSALALAMIIAAAIGGEPAESFAREALNVTVYALVGIILLKIGMLINDAVIFNRFSLKESIYNENVAAGVVHAANFLAVGIIIQSAIRWVETETWARSFLSHPAATQRILPLLDQWADESVAVLADTTLWEAWWLTTLSHLGLKVPEERRPLITLAESSCPSGMHAPGGLYLCLGPEDWRQHYNVLARVSDQALILFKERSPLEPVPLPPA